MSRFLPEASLPSHQCLGQHPELPEHDRHFPIAGGIERERDLALAGLLDLHDVAIKGANEGAVFLEGLEGKDHVLDRDRLAVVVASGGAQAKGGGRKVRGMTDRFRDKPVIGLDSSSDDAISVSQIVPAAAANKPLSPAIT